MFRSRFKSTPSEEPVDEYSAAQDDNHPNPLSRHQSISDRKPGPSRTSTSVSFASDGTPQGFLVAGPGPQVSLDPLGLQIAYEPHEPAGDIVFVHGLGGSAWRTWCWERDVTNFWPQWLPSEDIRFSSFRISTFGYNARFKGAGTNLDIVDFAKDLLLQLYTTFRRNGAYPGPIIFVAHSMGGLVVKKAYILGKYDRQYSDLVANVLGIVFLATPHRGSQFAKTLNNILSAAPIGAPPKAYIADLEKQSSSINEINVSFSQYCQELSLVSFYETLKTHLGLTKGLIVEKDSAVLGYPNEVSASLDADHHTVCKYKDRLDPNYTKVRGILKAWILSHMEPERPALLARDSSYAEVLKKVQSMLGVQDPGESESNLEFVRSLLATGSGRWLLERKQFSDWSKRGTEGDATPLVFWLLGLPGKGKTVLSACVIDHLHSKGQDVQYHLFSQGHQIRRTIAHCLRSIAAQVARKHSVFREALVEFNEETGISFKSQSQTFQYLWEKIFVGILFKLDLRQPMWWILDGVDEADNATGLITALRTIQSRTPIKIYLSSRPMKLVSLFDKLRLTSYFLQDADTALDVRAYTEAAVRNEIPDDTRLQSFVTDQILRNASGSFLWVRLALETLENNWYTREAIEAALTSVPYGMEAMYKQMVNTINKQQPRTREMAKLVLTWAACSWRSLTLVEMKAALELEFKDLTNLEVTINQICGHFINLEQSGGNASSLKMTVSLIHATAREFLLHGAEGEEPFMNSKEAHKRIAIRCLTYLSQDRWKQHYSSVHMAMSMSKKSNISRGQFVFDDITNPLLGYSTYYWTYHVSKAPTGDEDLTKAMRLFFSKYCLSWIEGIALSGHLQYLSQAARYLKSYVKRATRRTSVTGQDLDMMASLLSLQDSRGDYDWVESWAIDLIRVVGKFGSNLLRNPPSIYRHVPAFCPKESMMGKTYGDLQSRLLTVEGLASEKWDDCLASVNAGREDWDCSQVLATEAFFITLSNATGTLVVWGTDIFEQVRTICQDEWVFMAVLNREGTLVAAAGYKTFCVWELATGLRMHSFPRTSSAKVMDMKFSADGSQLIVALDDCSVAYHDLKTGNVDKTFIARLPQNDNGYFGCPGSVVISPDLSKIAMSWRGKVPLAWDLNHGQSLPPYSCQVKGPNDQLLYPRQLCWQPETNSLLILCATTRLVEWRILDEYQIEYDHIGGLDIGVSDDGNFLLSRNYEGTLSIWSFPRLNLVYSLLNTNVSSTAMAFSPNSQRFYDIRGPMCNVWEPDALVRPDEHEMEDASSAGGSYAVAEPIISTTGSGHILITSMAMTSHDKHFAYGREDGSVMIVDAHSGKRLRKVYNHTHRVAGDVMLLSWSKAGKFIASCDEFCQVIAKRLQLKEDGKWGVFPVIEVTLQERALQFLFSVDEKLLLISTPTEDSVWDLKAKKRLVSQDWGETLSRCWVQHPTRPQLLIWVEPSLVRTFSWVTLEQQNERKITVPEPSPVPGGAQRSVQWICPAHDNNPMNYLVYATLPEKRSPFWARDISQGGLQIDILPVAEIDLPTNTPAVTNNSPSVPANMITRVATPTTHMPTSLASHIKILVGISGQNVVFLDHEGWLSTWDITTASAEVEHSSSSGVSAHHECDVEGMVGLTRHFFVPKDWLNTQTSHLSVIDKGALFVPKYGDVAIVRGGMRG